MSFWLLFLLELTSWINQSSTSVLLPLTVVSKLEVICDFVKYLATICVNYLRVFKRPFVIFQMLNHICCHIKCDKLKKARVLFVDSCCKSLKHLSWHSDYPSLRRFTAFYFLRYLETFYHFTFIHHSLNFTEVSSNVCFLIFSMIAH